MSEQEKSEMAKKMQNSAFFKGMGTFLGQDTDRGRAQNKAIKKAEKGLDKVMLVAIGVGLVVAFGVWGLAVVGLIVFIGMVK